MNSLKSIIAAFVTAGVIMGLTAGVVTFAKAKKPKPDYFLIVLSDPTTGNQWICTAFAITPRVAITAAHCVQPPQDMLSLILGVQPAVPSVFTDFSTQITVVGALEGADIGVLKGDFSSVKQYKISNTLPKVGDKVKACGFPAGGRGACSEGEVTAVNGVSSIFSGTVIPGMSGGPVVNEAGEIVGVIQAYIDIRSHLSGSIYTDIHSLPIK